MRRPSSARLRPRQHDDGRGGAASRGAAAHGRARHPDHPHLGGLTEAGGPATVRGGEGAGMRCRWTSRLACRPARACAARCSKARGDGPSDHDGRRAADHRRDHDARPRRHEGLFRTLRRPRRRSRAAGSTPAIFGVMHEDGYHRDQGPLQGHHHLGRLYSPPIEVEGRSYRHPAVLEAAVPVRLDEKWGDPLRLRHAEGGAPVRARPDRPCRGVLAGLMPEVGRSARAAQDLYGQVQEQRAARACQGAVRDRGHRCLLRALAHESCFERRRQ